MEGVWRGSGQPMPFVCVRFIGSWQDKFYRDGDAHRAKLFLAT